MRGRWARRKNERGPANWGSLGLRDPDAPDFESAAFRALEGEKVPAGIFALDAEQAQFELALRASQQGFHDYFAVASGEP